MVPIRAQETHADTDWVSTDLGKTDLGKTEPVEANLAEMNLAKSSLIKSSFIKSSLIKSSFIKSVFIKAGFITTREQERSFVGLDLPLILAPFRLTTPRTILRWTEYGVALGAIIGTMAATITGKLVFAVTPLSLAVSLNLWRRQLSDGVLLQESQHNGQLILHHFHDALKTFEQEHHQFLLNHAGQFQPQDQPQVFQALKQSVFKLEAHVDAIQRFWQKQAQAEQQSLDRLMSDDQACWETLETLSHQIEGRWSAPQLEELTDYVQKMRDKVSEISLAWQPFLRDDAIARAEAVSLLRGDLQNLQDIQWQLEGLKHQWEGWVESLARYRSDLEARIDGGSAPIHQQLIALEQKLDLRSPSLPGSSFPTEGFIVDPSSIADVSIQLQSVVERLTNNFNVAWDHWGAKRIEFHEGLNLLHVQINALTTPTTDLYQQILEQNAGIAEQLTQVQFGSRLPGQTLDRQTLDRQTLDRQTLDQISDLQSLKQLDADLAVMRQDILNAIAQQSYPQPQATILAAQQTLSSQLAGLNDQLNAF